MTHETPHTWYRWLPLAEWWNNTSHHSSINTSPFEALYGSAPALYLPYVPMETCNDMVDRSLQKREEMLKLLKWHLQRAQHRMTQYANQKHSDREFAMGDFVFVKLQPYRQASMGHCTNEKLAHKFYGPYQMSDRIGKVAYMLELPSSSKIHPTFHVAQLKKCHGHINPTVVLPEMLTDVGAKREPEAIVDRKMFQRG